MRVCVCQKACRHQGLFWLHPFFLVACTQGHVRLRNRNCLDPELRSKPLGAGRICLELWLARLTLAGSDLVVSESRVYGFCNTCMRAAASAGIDNTVCSTTCICVFGHTHICVCKHEETEVRPSGALAATYSRVHRLRPTEVSLVSATRTCVGERSAAIATTAILCAEEAIVHLMSS